MKTKTFRPYDLDQPLLLPPSMWDWLPPDHLVYWVLDVVQSLDLSPVLEKYDGSKGGRPPYDPLMMVALLLYGYANGIRSSRKLERACYEQVPFRVLTGDQQPDHDTIAAFRAEHVAFLEDLFVQMVKLCGEAGLVRLGHIAVDGSKFKANASKYKAMSYERILKKEQQLREEITQIFAEAEEADREEDEKYGKGKRGDELPEELRTRQGRLAKIEEAKAALEQQAREAAAEVQRARDESDRKLREEGKSPRRKKPISDTPSPSAQRNFTDPESRMMMNGSTKSFEYAYNVQIAVDDKKQIIVATHVSQSASDANELKPLVEQVSENLGEGKLPEKLTADGGYFSDANVAHLEGANIDAYIATRRLKKDEKHSAAPRGCAPNGLSTRERMALLLMTKAGRAIYEKRKGTVEPVFGQVKECRGFRSFLLRGHRKVSGEWALAAAVHNLLKLIKHQKELGQVGTPA